MQYLPTKIHSNSIDLHRTTMTYRFFIFLLLASFFSSLQAQTFSGIFTENEAEMRYTQQTGWEAFFFDYRQQTAAGYRLLDVESNRVNGDERIYYGIYTQSNLQDSLGIALNWEEFVVLKKTMTDNGFLMVDIHAFALNERDRQYIGVWVKEELEHKIRNISTRDNLEKEIRTLGRRRFKLKRVHVVRTPQGVPEYVALFHHSPAQEYNYLQISTDLQEFQKNMRERLESGVNLIDYASFLENGERIYLGVYQKARFKYQFETKEDRKSLDEVGKVLKEKQGLSLMNLNVY